MWDLYLAFCEAAFRERHIGNVQLVFTKAAARLGDIDGGIERDDVPGDRAGLAGGTDRDLVGNARVSGLS